MVKRIDHSGQVFGKWTVLEYSFTKESRAKYYLCQCICGVKKNIDISSLRRKLSTRCKECSFNDRFDRIDISNMQFGKWKVLNFSHRKNDQAYWKCICNCGNENLISYNTLTRGRSKGCKHCIFRRPERGSKLYMVWVGMRQRCENKNNTRAYLYLDKGVKVCSEWQDFENYNKWAKENGYKEGLQIHRKDNTKNYCPENCVFVTAEEHGKISAQERSVNRKSQSTVR